MSKKFNFSKFVEQTKVRYRLLADEANKLICESAEYKNFKSPRAADIQAEADALLKRREDLRLAEAALAKDEKALREKCGLSTRWYDSDDFGTLGDYVQNKDKAAHFESRFRDSWPNGNRIEDLARCVAGMPDDKKLTVEEAADAIWVGTDLELIKANAKQLLKEEAAKAPATTEEIDVWSAKMPKLR